MRGLRTPPAASTILKSFSTSFPCNVRYQSRNFYASNDKLFILEYWSKYIWRFFFFFFLSFCANYFGEKICLPSGEQNVIVYLNVNIKNVSFRTAKNCSICKINLCKMEAYCVVPICKTIRIICKGYWGNSSSLI